MARKIVRPEYKTKHERMLAQEREHAMQLQDRVRYLSRVAKVSAGDMLAAIFNAAKGGGKR